MLLRSKILATHTVHVFVIHWVLCEGKSKAGFCWSKVGSVPGVGAVLFLAPPRACGSSSSLPLWKNWLCLLLGGRCACISWWRDEVFHNHSMRLLFFFPAALPPPPAAEEEASANYFNLPPSGPPAVVNIALPPPPGIAPPPPPGTCFSSLMRVSKLVFQRSGLEVCSSLLSLTVALRHPCIDFPDDTGWNNAIKGAVSTVWLNWAACCGRYSPASFQARYRSLVWVFTPAWGICWLCKRCTDLNFRGYFHSWLNTSLWLCTCICLEVFLWDVRLFGCSTVEQKAFSLALVTHASPPPAHICD